MVTLVHMTEFGRLEQLYHEPENQSPRFHTPDLISACVSVVFDDVAAADRIFHYIHTALLLRPTDTPKHTAAIWRSQYELLLALQRSPRNRQPNPQFNLDHFTTACVHLALDRSDAKHTIFEHARRNTAKRASAIT